jgi:ankyrin repeat protein
MNRTEERRLRLQKGFQHYLAILFEQGGPQAAFLNACVNGELQQVGALLNEDPGLASIPTGEVTPIRIAAVYGHAALAELLIRHGAPVNTPAGSSRDYPLHLAAICEHCDVIQALIAHGVEIDAQNQGGLTPLHHAADGNSQAAVRLLVQAGANLEHRDRFMDSTPLQHAIVDRNAAMVHELVRLGADVNAETSAEPNLSFGILMEHQWPLIGDFDGTRPLHIAVCVRWSEIVNLLLDHGADINALSFGWSALHAAVAIPDPDMIELLLRRGADPHVKADLKSRRGPEWNHHTPMDMLAGFRRSAQLLRDAQQRFVPAREIPPA